MKEWSLISCQMSSYLIRHCRRNFSADKLANGGFKKVLNKRVLLIVAVAGLIYTAFFDHIYQGYRYFWL